MSNSNDKLVLLDHLSIVKQYVDDKCGDLSNYNSLLDDRITTNKNNIDTLNTIISNINNAPSPSEIGALKNRINIIEQCNLNDTNFISLKIGKTIKNINDNIDNLNARVSNLENNAPNNEGSNAIGNITTNMLITAINSPIVLNGILKDDARFGTAIKKYIKTNGSIQSSNIIGSIPTSKLSGTVPASKITGTISINNLPKLSIDKLPDTIPFDKISPTTLADNQSIKSNNNVWQLNGDGSGKITGAISWTNNGNLTLNDSFKITWSNIADRTNVPQDVLNVLSGNGSGGSIDMVKLKNDYFGDIVGYRTNNQGSNILDTNDKNVITTVTDLLGDKIGILEYDANNKKVNVDADGKPIVTTVSSVIGDVTGAKAKYNEYNKMTGVEYDKDISVAAKFKEIEKNWIGESFKPGFETKTVDDDTTINQTTQTVSDVFNEIKIDWLGESLKPVYVETNGVKTRKSQNVEDILNELKTKWLGEVNDETNGNSIKLGVVRNEDGTIVSETSAAKVFNEIQVDWIGTGFKPSRDSNLIRTSQTVYDTIKEIKLEWLGGDISKSKSVASIVDNLSNNISINTKNITATTNTLNSHINGYNTTIGNINTSIESMRADIQDCDTRINAVNQSLFSSLTKEQVTNIINAAIQEGGLGETLATKADLNKYWTIDNHNGYVDAHDQTHLTKDQIININELVNYLSITDTNTLNSMLNAAGVTSTQWYESIKNAILAITDGRYAEAATESALSSYAKTADLTGGTITVKKADTANSATKATQDASGNVITSTYLAKNDISPSISASGNNIKITVGSKSSSTFTVPFATSATKATQDASGNVITSTYLSKTEASNTYLTQNNANSTYVTLATYNQLKSDYDSLLARVVALENKLNQTT